MRIIDMHDDLGQAYLTDLGGAEPSEFFKTASWRESSELLDRDFALILVDEEGHEHRKFASFDAGNTWMSVHYLLNVEHGLPDFAVKVAAANLLKSASAQKIALGEAEDFVGFLAGIDLEKTASFCLDERRVLVKEGVALKPFNMAAATARRAAMGEAGNVLTSIKSVHPQDAVTKVLRNEASPVARASEVLSQSNAPTRHVTRAPVSASVVKNTPAATPATSGMSYSPSTAQPTPTIRARRGGPAPSQVHTKATAPTASVPKAEYAAPTAPKGGYGHLAVPAAAVVGGAGLLGAGALGGMALSGTRKQGAASEFPVSPPTTPSASSLKMPSPGAAVTQPMTRLASFDIIKEAQQKWADFTPYEKRDLALSLVKIGSDESAQIPWEIEQYSGETLNPHFQTVMRHRQNYASTPELVSDYDRLGKVAGVLNLEETIEALYMLDEQAGILGRYGSALPDPVLAVCALEKKASYSWINGGHYANERQLILFSQNPTLYKRMKALFYEDMVDSFRKDPIGTFKKLPEEQKIIIVRLATQDSAGNDGGFSIGGTATV